MRVSLSKKISLSAMAAALALLFLYAAAVLPTGRIACLFLSSVFVCVLGCEGMYAFSLLSFLASALLAFLLLPDRGPAVLYAALLGHYGIFKLFVQAHVRDRFVCFILKLIYCNAFTFLFMLAAHFLFAQAELAAALPAWSWWLMLLVLQGAFVFYDFLYTLCVKFYENTLRNQLLPRR